MHSNMTSDSIMTRKVRPRSSPEFKVECALLVIDQGYSVREAAQAMGVGKSTLDKWIQKLKSERAGHVLPGCVFQTKVATDSRRSLPPIPRESCH